MLCGGDNTILIVTNRGKGYIDGTTGATTSTSILSTTILSAGVEGNKYGIRKIQFGVLVCCRIDMHLRVGLESCEER